jgi:D-alanine-D-alanine ligase
MKSRKIKVVLLFGGRSAEHEISLISAGAIYKNLDKSLYDVASVYINKKGDWRIVPSPLIPREILAQGRFSSFLPWTSPAPGESLDADIFFPVLHGPYGEDGTIQGLLEMSDMPYVGAGVMSSAVSMDKVSMKALFVSKNLPVVHYIALLETEWLSRKDDWLGRIHSEFAFPFFIKPANLGSSVGITKVKNADETAGALELAFSYDRKILVEEGICGREFECSVLGNDEPRASLPGEVIPFREFYDYEDKYLEGKTRFRIPADLPPKETSEFQRLAVEAYRAVDCSGMARIDFFLEVTTGRIYVNEINTIPGFTEISMYPKLWGASGLPFARLLDELIRLGFERHGSLKKNVERSRRENPGR